MTTPSRGRPSRAKAVHDPFPPTAQGGCPDDRHHHHAPVPLTFVTPDDAPFLIVHGTNDPLVPHPQSVEFRDALRKAGVPVALITVEGGSHGGFRNPFIERQVVDFFAAHLLGEKANFEDRTVPNTAP